MGLLVIGALATFVALIAWVAYLLGNVIDNLKEWLG